jgi:hypothetical protein
MLSSLSSQILEALRGGHGEAQITIMTKGKVGRDPDVANRLKGRKYRALISSPHD